MYARHLCRPLPSPSRSFLRAGARGLLGVLCLLPFLAPPASGADPESLTWTVITRDLYLDGVLRPDGRVLRSREPVERWAVVVPEAGRALVLDAPEERMDGGAARGPVTSFDLAGLTWSDPNVGSTPGDAVSSRAGSSKTGSSKTGSSKTGSSKTGSSEAVGHWVEVAEGGLLAVAGAQSILIQPHQGPAGPLTADELWQAVPRWRQLAETWQPTPEDEAAIAEIAAYRWRATVQIVFGTWCGDSRRSVPRLLAALERAGNDRLTVELVAIRRGFTVPLGWATSRQITNVPTVRLLEHGGPERAELGRLVERPVTTSMVTDLAALLRGETLPDPLVFDDEDLLLARGRYRLVRSAPKMHAAGDGSDWYPNAPWAKQPEDPGANAGDETDEAAAPVQIGYEEWSLFRTAEGDLRLGAVVHRNGTETRVWQRWHDRQGVFVEVTRTARGEQTRTRLWRDEDGAVRSLTRGDTSGIVEQIHHVSDRTLLLGPGTAAAGVSLHLKPPRPNGAKSLGVYTLAVPGAGAGSAATLGAVTYRRVDAEEVDIDGTVRYGEHLLMARSPSAAGTADEEQVWSEWWLDPTLGVPVKARVGDVLAELVWLETPVRDATVEASP